VHYPFEVIKYHQEFFDANLDKIKSDFIEEQTDVYMGEGVDIHPTAIIEPTEGPIVLEDGVSVGPFAHIAGPAIIGRGSRVIERATIEEQVQIEHTCKVGGEIECSIMEPYSNKQHHGFLGHSYIGSWVNLGAGTSNSDLKNTYGTVSIQHAGEKIDTEMQFLGCIIGDYSKTAINTSIFTGKIIGVSSFLYGLVGTNVPSFTNYARSLHQQTEIPPDVAAKVQKRMFKRRDVEQTDNDIVLIETMYKLTRNERLLSDQPLAF
jgi:glucose-1-phosphate thymidylyltransferase